MLFAFRAFDHIWNRQRSGWVMAALLLGLSLCASAQTVAHGPGKTEKTAEENGPKWSSLTKEQQSELQPLAEIWNSLGELRKRKWLAIASSSAGLGPIERNKLHERMEEWAKLSRKDRELARLNYAKSKGVGSSADWEAYQALSVDERKRLAEKAHEKAPSGAAVALKPVPSEKLIQVPVTRHTAQDQRDRMAAEMAVDRNTLLPLQTTANGTTPSAKH